MLDTLLTLAALVVFALPTTALAQQAAAPAKATAPAPRQPNPRQWEADIRRFEEADRDAPPRPGGVLFVGSSSIRLWERLADDFPGRDVIQRGFGGSQLGDVLYYAPRIVLPYRPRLVVVYAGDNDLMEGRTPEQLFADYRRLVALVHRRLPRTRIAFISIKPSPARWHLVARMRRTNALVRDYAARDPRRLLFVDVFTPMLGANGRPRAELFVDDSLHMSPAGYALWRESLAPVVR